MAGEAVCPMCKGTALIRKDGLPIELLEGQARGVGMTMAEIQSLNGPCGFCELGEKEAQFWKHWNEEMAKPIPPREALP